MESFDERDLERLKLQAEEQLWHDRHKTEFIQESLGKSQVLTKRMVDVLSTFGDRLSALENAIRPVHMETLTLTRARDNVKQVVGLLDDVIKHYDTSLTVQATLTSKPSYQLQDYIAAVNRVRQAIGYFRTSNPHNAEQENLVKLYNASCRALETEFEQVLERHSFPLPLHELMELSEVEAHHLALSADVVATLRMIATHLGDCDCVAELVRSLAKVRSACVASTLTDFAEAHISSVVATPGKSKVPGSAQKSTLGRRSSLRKGVLRSGSVRRRGERDDRRITMALDLQGLEDPDHLALYEKGSHPFLHYSEALSRLLIRETNLVEAILPPEGVSLTLQRLFAAPFDVFVGQGEMLAASVGKRVGKLSHQASLFAFETVNTLRLKAEQLKPIFNKIDKETFSTRLNELCLNFVEVSKQLLRDVEEDTFNDASKRMPPDGTVHELTSNTLSFFVALYDYAEIVGNVLRPIEEIGSRKEGIHWAGQDESKSNFAGWVLSVLKSLRSNLSKKAQSYDNNILVNLFLLNNYDFISQTINSAPYVDVLVKKHPMLKGDYVKLIDHQKQQYGQTTWQRAAELLTVETHSGTLTKKEREIIKEKYNSFNEYFDAVVKLQREYAIPNTKLRDSITKENINFLVPLYDAFDKYYRHSGFSSRNPQKYLKYTASEIEQSLGSLFAN
eukprot:m.169966 g.169966  ORF g.169966 m.169966 type:complete len:676 (+) comp21210_c0_seq1:16-2043(+)